MFELAGLAAEEPVRLHFGPRLPTHGVGDGRWIQTIPGVGWFVYLRIYGPEGPAFNGDWQLPDFQITS